MRGLKITAWITVLFLLLLLLVAPTTYALAGKGTPRNPLAWATPLSSQTIVEVGVSKKGDRIFALDSGGTAYILDGEGKLLDRKTISSLSHTLSGDPIYAVAPLKPGYLIGQDTSWGVLISFYDENGIRQWALPVHGRIASFSLSSSGSYLAIAYIGSQTPPTNVRLNLELYRDGSIVWRKTFWLASIVYAPSVRVAVSDNGRVAFYLPDSRNLTLYGVDGKPIDSNIAQGNPVVYVRLSDTGDMVCYCTVERASSALCSLSVKQANGPIIIENKSVVYAAGRPILASSRDLRIVAVWSGASNVTVYRIEEASVSSVNIVVPGARLIAVSGDGSYVAVGYMEELYLFSSETGSEAFERALIGYVDSLSFSERGGYLVAGDDQGNIYFFVNPLVEESITLTRIIVGAFILVLGLALIILSVKRSEPGGTEGEEYDEEIFPPEEQALSTYNTR